MATPAAVLAVLITAKGVSEASQKIDKLQTQLEKANTRLQALEKQNERTNVSMKRTGDSAGALEKRFTHLDKTVGDFNRVMMAARNAVMVLKFPAMIAGAGMAAQAVGALAAGVVALTSALGPVVGAAAGAAGGFVAMGQALGVVKLAFADVGKALGGNKKALEALTPSQRKFVETLKGMQGEVKALRQVAASNLFSGLTGALQTLKPMFGTLRPIVAGTAKELGNLALQAARSVKGWGPDIQTIGKNNIGVIHNLGSAAISLAGAFKDVLVVAQPLTNWMSQLALRGAKFIESQVKAGRESGKLAGFLERTKQVMTTLGHITANLAVGLYNIAKAGAPLGRDLLGSLEKLTKRFREWTASAEGKNSIADYFRKARDPLYQMFGLVGDLSGALGRLMTPSAGTSKMVGGLREMVPVLESVIASTTKAFGPPLIAALTQVVRLFGALAGTSGPLNLAVAAIGKLAGWVADLFDAIPFLKTLVVTFLGLGSAGKLLGFAFRPLAGLLTPLLGAFGLTVAKGGLFKNMLAALRGDLVKTAESAKETAATTSTAAGTMGGGIEKGVEQAATSSGKFSKVAGKLRTGLNSAMRGVGIGVGGMLVTEMASQMVGGGEKGKWVKAIGTGASIGMAIGSVFGPEGTVAGGIIGGIGSALIKWAQGPDPVAEGRAWAQGFVKDLPNTVTPKVKSALEKASGASNKAIVDNPPPSRPIGGTRAGAQYLGVDSEAWKADWTKAFNDTYNASVNWGYTTGQVFGQQMSKTALPTGAVWLSNIETVLRQVPAKVVAQGPTMVAAWRNQAAQQMIGWAAQMEASGALPKGATDRLIASLEAKHQGLKAFLIANAMGTGTAVAAHMRMQQAETNVAALVTAVRTQLGYIPAAAQTTGKNWEQKLGSTMANLRTLMKTGTDAQKAAATSAYNAIIAKVRSTLNAGVNETKTKMPQMARNVANNTSGAARAAGENLGDLARSVQSAMRAGTVSAASGSKMISDAINAMLTAFQAANVPLPALVNTLLASEPKTMSTFVGGGHGGHFARGGMVNRPGYFAGEQAPAHPEVILATNPAYRKRNQGLWARAGGMLGVPGFAQGGMSDAIRAPTVQGGGSVGTIARQGLGKATTAANKWIAPRLPGVKMMNAAQSIVGLPYIYGGGHGGFDATGYDCSGAVSFVLHAGGFLGSPMTTDGLKNWGDSGPGKFITVAVRGSSGKSAHTMMEFYDHYFESGGGGGGPHWDAGWNGSWPIFRHPPGFAQGGVYGGDFGDQPPASLLARTPQLAKSKKFLAYAKAFGAPGFAKGGIYGGIPGFAGGGVFRVGASEFGGPNDSSTHGSNSGAYGTDVLGSIARLKSGGGLWDRFTPHSKWTLTANTGRSVGATVTDWGSGGGSVGGLPRAIDLWWETANALGLPGTAGTWTGVLTAAAGSANTTATAKVGATTTKTGAATAKTGAAIPKFKPTAVPKLKMPFKAPSPLDTPIAKITHPIVGLAWPMAGPAVTTYVDPPYTAEGKNLSKIMDANTGSIAVLADLVSSKNAIYDQLNQEYGTAHPGLDTSTGLYPADNSVTPPVPAHRDDEFINRRIAQLTEIVDYQARIKANLEDALRTIDRLLAALRKAIETRQAIAAKIRSKIGDNVRMLGTLAGLTKNVKNPKKMPAKRWVSDWAAQSTALQNQNVALGGEKSKVGTGGILGTIAAQIGDVSATGQESLRGRIADAIANRLTIVGPSGIGGTLGQAKIDLNSFADQLAVFSPARVTAALAAANVATSATPAAPDQSALVADLTQQIQQANLRTAVSEAQQTALEGWPPYGGSFAEGGIVPGPTGIPRTIIAHGGEGVGQPGEVTVNLMFANGMEWMRDFVRAEVQQQTRRDASGRALPGRG